VEAARALLGRARILVFDEPTAALSGHEIEHLFGVIRSLREEGMGIIHVSHRLDEVFSLADRLTVLRDGKRVTTTEVTEIDRSTLIRWMVGRDLDEEFPRRIAAPGETVLDVSGLGSAARFHNVSFALRRGEILGLAGLVGAGRTSVGRALFGAARISSGTMRLAGQPYAPRSPREALDRGVGYLTEDRQGQGIFRALSVRENVVLPTLHRHLRGPFFSRTESGRAAARACEDLRVRSASLEVPISTLSGGNQQKALLGRLLRHELKILVLDEPTRGIDVGSRAEIYRIVVDLAARGLAVIILSSELPELLGLCDRIVVLSEGQVTGVLGKDEATQERILDLATPDGGRHPARHGAKH
jgi:ABC-type sugar transport system ATPase subunit